MPLLTRMVGTPLTIDIGPGAGREPRAAARRPADLRAAATSRSSVGPGLGEEIAEIAAAAARERRALDGRGGGVGRGATTLAAAAARGLLRRARRDRRRPHARRRQVRRDAQRACRWSRWRPSLAHDGIASPVASLEDARPQGLLRRADADRGRGRPRLRAPQRPGDAPLGDRRRDLQPVRDRGLAAGRARARRAGRRRRGHVRAHGRDRRSLHREDGIDDDAFLIALAEALVLSGLAMATAGSSRPVQRRRPRDPARDRPPLPRHRRATASWPAPASLFTAFLRGDDGMAARHRRVPARHGLPRTPRRPRPRPRSSSPQAVVHAPRPAPTATRSSSTSTSTTRERRASRVRGLRRRPSIAELRAAHAAASIFARNSGEHWAGRLYMRRLSPYLTRLLPAHAADAERA